MTIVFDKENARSFFRQLNTTLAEDIFRLLKRQLNIVFNFSREELESDEKLEMQIGEFHETGGRKKRSLTIEYLDKPLYEEVFCLHNVYNNNSVFLLEKITGKIKEAHKVLIGSVGEEIEVLSRLLVNVEDGETHDQRIIGSQNFKDWNAIEEFVRPFSTLIVVDRYMFKGPEIGGNLGLFDYNLKIFLQHMYKNQKQRTDIVFIYQIDDAPPKTRKNYDEGPDLQKLKNRILNAIKQVNKYCPKPRLTFIAVPKGKIEDDHDRHIITNYIRIKSGDSLVYFDSTGRQLTTSNEFDIYSLARKQYEETTYSLLDKLKVIVQSAIDNYAAKCELNGCVKSEEIISI